MTSQQRTTNDAMLYAFELIRETVSALDVGRVLGLDINGHGRCRCPFHNGADRNMMVYPGNRGYYCFVCHEHGDSIRLAQRLLGDDYTYTDAAKWIDSTFQLNIYEKKTPSIRERIRMANRRARCTGGAAK